MRFTQRELARKLYVRRDKFWEIYKSDEVQSYKDDQRVIGFPTIYPEDIDYAYVYEYTLEWIRNSYKPDTCQNISVKALNDNEYSFSTKSYSGFNQLAGQMFNDFKEYFLRKLKYKPSGKNLEVKQQIQQDVPKAPSQAKVTQSRKDSDEVINRPNGVREDNLQPSHDMHANIETHDSAVTIQSSKKRGDKLQKSSFMPQVAPMKETKIDF
ncbi:hypothetical protein [Candidatus Borreliella tachyglossi]|uniref:hypothetical protein n=1 Tax=Candidatus Borreliella tachyglossi TaxID=1964448 RepID=UPI004041B2B4